MAKLSTIEVHPVPGARSTSRAVAYLVFDGETGVDAWPVLNRMDQATYQSAIAERRNVWGRFHNWVSGLARHEYHHGWPDDPEFSMGYVFRWDHQRQHRRLYGFLMSPRLRFEVCVLCSFRVKEKWQTETAVKKLVRAMSQHAGVQQAVRNAFKQDGGGAWDVH